MAGSIGGTTINIGGPDPIQGFDVGVWVTDPGRGEAAVLAAQFTSMVITIRNASEPYNEFGQRMARILDGEIQIGFVLEKGLVDMNIIQETFGFKHMSRSKRFGRSPRLNVTFGANPVDADALEAVIANSLDGQNITRDVTGRFILENCKMDSLHLAATAGRQVAAAQWQGVAEGILAIPSDYSIIKGLTSPFLTSDGTTAIKTSYAGSEDGIATTDRYQQSAK